MNKKRFFMLACLALAMFFILGCGGGENGCAGCVSCVNCAACSTAPELDTVYDRVVELIEASKEVNVVLYGSGLPVYEVDSSFSLYNQIYGVAGTDTSNVVYEYVTEYAKFQSESEIKELAQKVYTPECLAPFYTSAFDGNAFADSKNGMVVDKARFDVSSEYFGQLRDMENGLKGIRIFDYSSMEIVQPSTKELFRVKINSWLDSSPENVQSMTLAFALKDDGLYYLDSFTA